MSATTLERRINVRKEEFLEKLKKQGVYIEFCPKRGYIYQIVQTIIGCVTRVTVALKNGKLFVLGMVAANGMTA